MRILASRPRFFPSLETTHCKFTVLLRTRIPQSSLSSKSRSLRLFSTVRLQSSNRPGLGAGPPGENDSKAVLEAFFLGKALVEAVSERVESTVGEVLSTLGRWQAEQQKQARDLQDEVFERAKKSKEKAARGAMEEQGIIPKKSVASVNIEPPAVSSTSADPDNKENPLEIVKD